MDDFDIEFIDLQARTSGSGTSGTEIDDSVTERRLHKRNRIIRGASVAIIVISGVILAFLHASSSFTGNPAQSSDDSRFHVVFFTHSAPWGKLSIDGRQQSGINDLSFVSLSVGKHDLLYQAPPFPVLRCSLHIPRAMPGDTCPLYRPPQGDPHFGESRRVVDLGVTLQRIPSEQRVPFINAAQSALGTATSTTQVLPGEHYVSPNGQVMMAEGLIIVRLEYNVVNNFDSISSQAVGDESCSQNCASSNQENDWLVNISISPQWIYTLPAGERATMPSLMQTGKFSPSTILLDVQWTGVWRITLPQDPTMMPDTIICSLAESGASHLVAGILTSGEGMSVSSASAPSAADGCLATVTLTDEFSEETHVQLLFRFGVYFAANADAHQLFPSLPVVSRQEMLLVNSLLQSP